MQPPGTLVRSRQQISLDDFDYGFVDYDRPRRRTQDDTLAGHLTPDTFTVLPPLPPPTPSPPPAPRPYRLSSPTRRQRKASFVIIKTPESQLPGSARSIRVPSPGESRKLPPPGKSRIPRSQPVSREPSPARNRSVTQQRRASVSQIKTLPPRSKPSSPKNGRKISVKKQRDNSTAKSPVTGEKDAQPSPSRIPRPPAARGRKSPAPSREQSPARKNSKVVNQKKGASPAVNRQQTVLRKNSNLKPLSGKPPLPPASKGKQAAAGVNKTNPMPEARSKPGANKSKTSAPLHSEPTKTESKPVTEKTTSVTEDSSKVESESSKNTSKPEAESSKDSAGSNKSLETRTYVNPTMASAPATFAQTTSNPNEETATSITSAPPMPAPSSVVTPDTSTTLVSTTTAPTLELAKPSSEPYPVGPTKSSSDEIETSAMPDKSAEAVAESMESVRSSDSVVTVRAASSPRLKKKTIADDVATSEAVIKGDPDLESLSPNTNHIQQQDSSPG
ncbi:hypothetical protein L798_12232 [Zootermopsis nevadensis]|uniref:Uncharacterized protein n=2 Tax=Zootermopsis nevadensis TaxID=136037 RepID=A0A067R5C7_ZOONE|nr:hypothetical protein L798_12232 [Zootermopsis nevadensis]